MNRKQYENVIRDYPLTFPKAMDTKQENRKLPSLKLAYEYFWDHNRKPPSQTEYVDTFYTINNLERNDALTARLHRGYPSIVRDHHIQFLFEEHFDACMTGGFLDRSGIDALVVDGNFSLPIAAFKASPRGFAFRGRKVYGKDTEVFSLPIRTREATIVGDYELYGENHVQLVKDEIARRKQVVHA